MTQTYSHKKKIDLGKAYISLVRSGKKTAKELANEVGVGERTLRRFAAYYTEHSANNPIKKLKPKSKQKTGLSKTPKFKSEPTKGERVQYSYLQTANAVQIVRIDQSAEIPLTIKTVTEAHPKWKVLIEKLKKNQADPEFFKLFFEADIILSLKTATNNKIQFSDAGSLMIDGVHVKTSELTDVLFNLIQKDETDSLPFKKLSNFLVKLSKNPDPRIYSELYNFLKHNDIEIAENGDVIAYKVVTHDYKDCYTKTISNKVGKTVSMLRKLVNNDPKQTCSHGLHVCAKGYIKHYKSKNDIVVRVSIAPQDFVSVPVDYNGMKARVCKYKVLSKMEIV